MDERSDPAYHRALHSGDRLYTPERRRVDERFQAREEDWVNPSSSYPLMAVATHYGVPYGLVLRYAENLWGNMSEPQVDNLRAELSSFHSASDTRDAWSHNHWMRCAARAVGAELRKRREAHAQG